MIADELQDLYKLLRGTRTAMEVFDARSLLMDNHLTLAHEKLAEAREAYSESCQHVLRQDAEKELDTKSKDKDKGKEDQVAERRQKRIERKREKAITVLEVFDELLPALERLIHREQRDSSGHGKPEPVEETEPVETEPEETEPEETEPDAESVENKSIVRDDESERGATESFVIASRSDISDQFVESYLSTEGDERLDLINQAFGFREVKTDADIHPNAIYFILAGKQNFLVRTPSEDGMRESVTLVSVVDEQRIKPFTRGEFLKLGTRRRMVLLIKGQSDDRGDAPSVASASEGSVKPEESVRPSVPAEPEVSDADTSGDDQGQESAGDSESAGDAKAADSSDQNVLDMGAFGQLLSAAQRSGIVPGADHIAYVRDREFRIGRYDLAFQAIDSLFSQFCASASGREQRLVREDADIAAGRIKISPKDLQAKRARDRREGQEIDRARRRFQVVLEGLRRLTSANRPTGHEPPE